MTPPEWRKLRRLAASSAGQDVEPLELSYTPGGNAAWYRHFGALLGNFVIDLPYAPEIPFLGVASSKRSKTYFHKKTVQKS